MNKLSKFLVFSMILFIGLGVACAASVDDANIQDTEVSSVNAAGVGPVDNVVEDTSNNNNLIVEEDVGDNTDPGANPTQYTSISETTYNNAVITLSGDQSFTDGVATFGNNVTLTSDETTRTLNNLKIIVSGNNVTINNVYFNHQTSTATKVIDVVGASNVLINNADITLSKNSAVTTMGISVSANSDNVVINGSDVDVSSASQGLVWNEDSQGNWYSTLAASAVVVDDSTNVKIANGSIKIQNTTSNLTGTTMPALTITSGASNVEVYNNTINATGAQYNYGIMCNDYVSDLDIKYNHVNVTGEVYTAGMDVSTSTSSEVKYNNITVNSTNSSVIASGSEALSYGIILATYQVHNNNNVISYNNISLIANVGYGIENYMGSVNTIEYNNITIHAKRTIGIATNASNNNNYKYNNINLYCNNDDINYFYETIPAQNVGIIVIGANTNNIQYNNITITENTINTNTYAVILADDTLVNTVINNVLYVYNINGISKMGDIAIYNHGVYNIVTPNLPISQNNLNLINKNFKQDDDVIIITGDNIADYGTNSGGLMQVTSGIPSNSNVIIYVPTEVYALTTNIADFTIKIKVISTSLSRWQSKTTIVDSYLPGTRIQTSTGVVLINSTFLDVNQNGPQRYPDRWTIENSTILTLDEKVIVLDDSNYTKYFDSTTNILLDSFEEGTSLVLRQINAQTLGRNNFNTPLIINKPINIISYYPTNFNADITFVSGSEGSNITGLTLNGNLYINTSNINVKNNTINKAVIIKDASDVVVEENTFNTDTAAIEVIGGIQNTIQNNNIATTSTYTITLDADSAENTITGNNLQAAQLTGADSVLDEGEDNTITDGGDEPVIVEPVLKVDTTEFTVGETTVISASIYMGDEVATDINGGKVVFKVNGKTLKDANGKVIYAKLVNGTATIPSYEIPVSWNKENVTITAVYSGTSKQDALRSEEAQITITQPEPTITTDDIMTTTGETVQLKAKVSIADNPITTGKVVFKVNGKTVKDANGKVIYATVDETGAVSVNYTIPENMKAGDYVITVTYTSAVYGKLTSNATLTVSS